MPPRRAVCTQLLSALLLLIAVTGPGAGLTHAQTAASASNQSARTAGAQIAAADAAEIVRRQYGGRVMGVKTLQRDGRVIYQVRILQDDGRMRTISVDGHSGKISNR